MGVQPKVAIITGITGQDGAYLAQFLLQKNYRVVGLIRWEAANTTWRLQDLDILDKIGIVTGDLTDPLNLIRLLKEFQPEEIYNLGALSHVKASFETPLSVFDINTKGLLTILESVKVLGLDTRIYQASSSEMYGETPNLTGKPQDEETVFMPSSPYAVSKLASFELARVYRRAYGIHVSNGILFNHESPLRGEDFVTSKIAKAVVRIAAGLQDDLVLGNLDARRDWGYAPDYVQGMWQMLQQEAPDDYVLATGTTVSVRDFVNEAFGRVGISLTWNGSGMNEVAVCKNSGRVLVRVSSAFFRPLDVLTLTGDASKAQRVLGWQPSVSFSELVSLMVEAETQRLNLAFPRKEEVLWRSAG